MKNQNARIAALERIVSWAISARKTNTREWMQGLSNRLNVFLDVEGDGRRSEFDGDIIQIFKADEVRDS